MKICNMQDMRGGGGVKFEILGVVMGCCEQKQRNC